MVSWRATATTGFLAGGVVGLRAWNADWPQLAIPEVWRGAALGWLFGVIVGLLGERLGSRRRPAGGGVRPARRGATLLALLPLALWATWPLPGGLLRKALPTSRAAGETRPNLILISIDACAATTCGQT